MDAEQQAAAAAIAAADQAEAQVREAHAAAVARARRARAVSKRAFQIAVTGVVLSLAGTLLRYTPIPGPGGWFTLAGVGCTVVALVLVWVAHRIFPAPPGWWRRGRGR